MNTWHAFIAGISPHHVPALLAALLLLVVAWVTSRMRARRDRAQVPTSLADRWAALLLGISAMVHLALPLGDHDNGLLVVGFLTSGIAYGWLAFRALTARSYRALAAPLIIATLTGYVISVLGGSEEPDQVGIATALDELFVLTLCLVPLRRAGQPRRIARLAGSAASVMLTIMAGLGIWAGALKAVAGHGHAFAARAQAGLVIRPVSEQAPTDAQVAAAAKLAAQTKADSAKYSDIHTALDDGYKFAFGRTGYEVHLTRKASQSGRPVPDPNNPSALVYAVVDGRATLLGVLYQMPEAGVPGPAVGGPITRWHAHNGCGTLLPPGLGIMSPFGTCPAFSLQATTPEMMHVWVVDPPGGAFADSLSKKWVRAYNAAHGVPFL